MSDPLLCPACWFKIIWHRWSAYARSSRANSDLDFQASDMVLVVDYKNHVASLKVKVRICTRTSCIGLSDKRSCPIHYFVFHGGIIFGTNDHYDKTMRLRCVQAFLLLGHSVFSWWFSFAP